MSNCICVGVPVSLLSRQGGMRKFFRVHSGVIFSLPNDIDVSCHQFCAGLPASRSFCYCRG